MFDKSWRVLNFQKEALTSHLFPSFPIYKHISVYGHIHDYERYLPVYNYTVFSGVEAGPGNQSVYRRRGRPCT